MDRASFDALFNSVPIVQHPEEFYWLVNHVEQVRPHCILEIGVQFGGTAKFWEQLLQPHDLLIEIDENPDTPNLIRWNWRDSSRQVKLILGNSSNASTEKQVQDLLAGRDVDFLYIDGDHSLEAVTNDFYRYTKFVRKGGLVGFHDLYTDVQNPKKLFDSIEGRKEERWLGGQGTGIWWKDA